MAENKFEERRRANIIREVLLPVVVAVVTGIGSSYVTTQVTIAVIETRLKYLENNFLAVNALAETIKSMQIEFARNSERMTSMSIRIENTETLSKALAESVKDRYTAKDAEKDYNALAFKIRNHTHVPSALGDSD